MQTPQSSLNDCRASYAANIIVETLRRTSNNKPINLSEIAQASRTTLEMTRKILSRHAGLEDSSGKVLRAPARFRLARIAAQLGVIDRAVRALTWQEFEQFAEECLIKVGFETRKGVVFNDGTRRWQIDILAMKNPILLTLDCKHWKSPNYASRFNSAIEHQKLSIGPLIRHLRAKERLMEPRIRVLPMILTLFEHQEPSLNGVVMISVGQLPDFLEHLTPYNTDLTFIQIDNPAESPIC